MKTRVTAFVGVTGIVVALAGIGAPAEAATASGVGTTTVTSKLVDLNVAGGVLDVSLFTDQGSANTDPKAGPSSAKNTVTTLSLSSTLTDLSSIDKALSALTAPVSAQSPPNQNVNTSLVDLAKTAPAAAPVLSGQIDPINLVTTLDAVKGATSGLTSALTNLQVLSGVAGITTLANQDALASAPSAASASRNFKLGSIPILNLGAILKGLGIDPSRLPVSTVTSLVDKLGLNVPALAGNKLTLTTATTTLLGLVGLQGQADQATQNNDPSKPIDVSGALAGAINKLGGTSLPSGDQQIKASDLTGDLGKVQQALGDVSLSTVLSSLLSQGLSGLLTTPLLEVDTGALQVVTKAAATIADSTATVSAGTPTLKVLGMSVPGIDTLISTLQSVLATINQNLAGLVKLSLLDKSTNVTQANGYTDAVARAAELKLTIDPGAITGGVKGVIASLPGVSPQALSASSLDLSKTAVGSLVPSLKLPDNPFTDLLNAKILNTDAPLALGATTLSLGQVTSESKFTLLPATPAAPAQPSGTMPRTGRELGPWAAMAAVLLALSLGARRWLGRARATTE